MNPFLPIDEYIPDGEPHVFGDRIYLFGSHDKEGGDTFCMLDYVGYSAPIDHPGNWRCEGVIYRAVQDPVHSDLHSYLYAPDVVRGCDGRYYLYYALAGPKAFTSPIHVAVCGEPAGKYEYYGCVSNPDGTPFTRYITFDPAVINDGGKIRLYYGWALASENPEAAAMLHSDDPKVAVMMREKLMQVQMQMFGKSREEIEKEPDGIMGANTVELAEDMLTVISEPKRILPGQFDSAGSCFEGHAFFEGSSIRKIRDTYYFIYSSELSHELCYATSKYPDKEFTFGGTLISNGDIGYQGRKAKQRLNTTGNNHGSVEKVGEDWYLFYHRHTHHSVYSRQACAEKIEFQDGGFIPQVEMTSLGFEKEALPARGDYPAAIACNLTNGRMPHLTGMGEEDIPHITHNGEERYITCIDNGTLIGFKYFQFTEDTVVQAFVRGAGKGKITIYADQNMQSEIMYDGNNQIGVVGDGWKRLIGNVTQRGKAALYFYYEGEGTVELLRISFMKKEEESDEEKF